MTVLKKRQRLWWLAAFCFLVFSGFFFLTPLPYYIEAPGGTFDTATAIQVEGKKPAKEGGYQFVAVAVSQATPASMLYAWLTPFTTIEPEKEVTGGASNADYERINTYYMKASQDTAVYQANLLAGQEVSLVYKGVYVMSVADNSTFKNTLHIADTVTAINGQTFASSKDLVAYVGQQKQGAKVTITYESDGKSQTAKGKIVSLSNGKNGIGITLVDHTEIKSKNKVTYSTDGVGGPSAGLLFTLTIYDELTGNHLLKGRQVAGTGTIASDGSVGDVGGVALKVKAAADAGADIFFVPNNPVSSGQTNYEEAKASAKRLKTKMVIVPVTKAQDAIDYLKETK
ncbi:SepM family pheromone-processing serine protease [Streptococcus sp. DD12]|uniref:SepM family pheromone-processing serine protease n=1 Tax=Streptococcus sp. DD12 TaxID=1777880 RepID=UPI000797AA94|nr:SepM family pheromone-processing serine protease [Streptococcus sp. DD12]KXT76675.1 Lon-like protease with PDZ domain [Streptococcus sp. DD12]